MDWSIVAKLLVPLAPTLGSLVGGLIPIPGGSLLGGELGKWAQTELGKVLGVEPTPEAVGAAIQNADPETIKAQLSASEAQANAEVEKLKAYLADVADARSTTVQLVQAGSAIAWGPVVISVLITGGFIGCIAGLMFARISFSETSGQAYLILTGVLSQAFAQVTSYWLGSSAGSAQKTDQLAALAASAGIAKAIPIKKK